MGKRTNGCSGRGGVADLGEVLPKAPNSWRALTENSIVRAFGISLLAHLIIFIVLEAGYGMGLWKTRVLPSSNLMTQADIERIQKLREQQQQQRDQTPITLQFVEVDPARATPEEPKDAPFYSVANTRASNPDPKELQQPKVDGSQTKVPKVADVMAPQNQPQPPPQPQQPQRRQPDVMQPVANNQQQAERQEPEGTIPASEPQEKKDLAFTNPSQDRPRRLADARARKGIIEGEAMKQEGGVKRGSLETNLDVKASPFGSYDAAFIAAVQKRWFDLLDQRNYVHNRSGRVVVEFRLYPDGRIQSLKIARNEVNETLSWLCQRAILDPSPYAPFPADLRKLLAQEYREVRFTFHYN